MGRHTHFSKDRDHLAGWRASTFFMAGLPMYEFRVLIERAGVTVFGRSKFAV